MARELRSGVCQDRRSLRMAGCGALAPDGSRSCGVLAGLDVCRQRVGFNVPNPGDCPPRRYPIAAAEHLEQRLAAIVEQSNQRHGWKFHLALSVGMLVCDKASGGFSFEELLDRADALMYERKQAGKGRSNDFERVAEAEEVTD